MLFQVAVRILWNIPVEDGRPKEMGGCRCCCRQSSCHRTDELHRDHCTRASLLFSFQVTFTTGVVLLSCCLLDFVFFCVIMSTLVFSPLTKGLTVLETLSTFLIVVRLSSNYLNFTQNISNNHRIF